MPKRLIRSDEFGIYVITGGYVFRPQAVMREAFFKDDDRGAIMAAIGLPAGVLSTIASQFTAGQHANARHVAGTTTASVGGETWISSSADPRYVEYDTHLRTWPRHG